MLITVLKSKIHRATVTGANTEYEGSISIDAELLNKVGISEYEQVLVADVTNGQRLTTYAIAAPPGSRSVVINGAAAKLVKSGDLIIVMAFGLLTEAEVRDFSPSVVRLGTGNRVLSGPGGLEEC